MRSLSGRTREALLVLFFLLRNGKRESGTEMEEKLYRAGYKYRGGLLFQALGILALYLALILKGPLWASIPLALIVVTPWAVLFGWVWSTLRFDVKCGKDTLEIKRLMVLPTRVIAWSDIREVEMKRDGRVFLHLHEAGAPRVYLYFPRWGADIDYHDLLDTIEERVALAHEKADVANLLSE